MNYLQLFKFFYDGNLDYDSTSYIGNKLLLLQKTYPDQFNSLSDQFPQLNQLLNYYYSFEKSILINSIQYQNTDDVKYISEITIPLQKIAIDDMFIQLAYAENIKDIDSKQELTKKITYEFLDEFYTLDPTGNKITMEKHIQRLFPTFSYDTALLIMVESEYIFSIPVISYEDQLISIDELCQLKIDEQKCELLKEYAILAHNVAKKDPDAALTIAKIILEITIDVNDKTNAGYDSELLFILYFADKTSDELLDEKIFRLDGKLVSLNQLTNLQCGDANISLAEKLIVNYNFKKQNVSQLQSEYNDVINLLQNIDENSCSISIIN